MSEAGWPIERLAPAVEASPRANAYLSLEPGLRQIATDNGVVTWAASKRHAFIVGGIHQNGGQDGAEMLAHARDQLREARYRRVLLFPVAESERQTARESGFRSLMVGSEAFVDPQDFALRGKRYVDLRQMLNRATKRYGVRIAEVAATTPGLASLYAHWLANRPAGHQMSLLIGTPCLSRAAGRRYLAAFVPQSPEPVAFVSLTPGWGGAGWGVDVMVRGPEAPAGVMEALLTEAVRQSADLGATRFSLGACPMAEHAQLQGRDSRFLRAVFRWLYRSWIGNHLFAFRSLTFFKNKFAPTWEGVYMAAWPTLNVWSLYAGCRMWGLFGPPPLRIPAKQPG
ncbi:MAG: lysylphosphatidylglycerol synthetase-like protein (DUF2156 family) [Myxococcota bacterium]